MLHSFVNRYGTGAGMRRSTAWASKRRFFCAVGGFMDEKYLLEEREGKLLAKFAIPCILSLVISCLYNIVDQIFVGNGIGPLANAATGVVFPITVVGWGLSLFFGDGAAASMSISLGKGEREKTDKIVANAILMTFLSGCALITVAYIAGDKLLMLLGGTEANIGYAHEYGVIIYAMIPLALVQSCLASIIRADGSPKYAMLAMVVGAVINIIGDPIAIYALKLGMAGAAYATIIGQFVSFLLSIAYLFKSKNFKVRPKSFIPDFKALGAICKLGISSLLTQLCIVATTVVNNVLFVKYGYMWDEERGGDVALAAFVVIMKLFQIIINVAIGIAAGAQPIVGYNYGAGRYDRVKKLLKLMLMWTAGICVVCTVIIEAAPRALISMFGGANGGVGGGELYMRFALPCIRIYMMFIAFTCLQKVCAIFLQSVGYAALSAPLSFLRDILVILFAFCLPLSLGVFGVVWAAPVADAVAFLITAAIMIFVVKKLNALDAASKMGHGLQNAPSVDVKYEENARDIEEEKQPIGEENVEEIATLKSDISADAVVEEGDSQI